MALETAKDLRTGRPTVPFDRARLATTFRPFPSLANVDSTQLHSWLSALQTTPISAIEWQWSEGWSVGPRVVNDSMWFWFSKGAGTAYVGGEKQTFKFGPGDLILIPQGAEHLIKPNPGSEVEVTAVHFYAKLYGGINLLQLLGFPALIRSTPNSPIPRVNRKLSREFAVKAPGWTTSLAGLIYEALLFMVRMHAMYFHVAGSGIGHGELPRLLPTLEFLYKNLADVDLTIGQLARCTFLSESQFRRLFTRVIGTNPVHFIQQQRIDRACKLLRTTDCSIEQIAESCGFADTPFFVRVFKTWTGVSPRRYRMHTEM